MATQKQSSKDSKNAKATKTPSRDTNSKKQSDDSKKQERKNNRREGAKELLNNVTIGGAKVGAEIIRDITHGNVLKGLGKGVKHAVKGISSLIKSITGLNDKSWYVKYFEIQPAANEDRPMQAVFNGDITDEANSGTLTRFIDTYTDWVDYPNSTMFKQTISNAFKLLRIELKSNLPYSEAKLSAYVVNAIAVSVAAKMIERDFAWYNYNDPTVYNFSDMFIKRTKSTGAYGRCSLETAPSVQNYTEQVNLYERLRSIMPTAVRIPRSLAEFIAHYYGTLFVDNYDGKNSQYITMNMRNIAWAEYNKESDTVTYSSIDLTKLTADTVTARINEITTNFGIVVADLINSEQYDSVYLDDLDNYAYTLVYDRSFLQALVNAYTDNSAVTDDGYVRLDRMIDVDDDLTQYIFMGALQPRIATSFQSWVPAIQMVCQVLKYDSNPDLKWTPVHVQTGAEVYYQEKEPFGMCYVTSMIEDYYVMGTDLAAAETSPAAFGAPLGVSGTALGLQANADIFEYSVPTKTTTDDPQLFKLYIPYLVRLEASGAALADWIVYAYKYVYNNTLNRWEKDPTADGGVKFRANTVGDNTPSVVTSRPFFSKTNFTTYNGGTAAFNFTVDSGALQDDTAGVIYLVATVKQPTMGTINGQIQDTVGNVNVVMLPSWMAAGISPISLTVTLTSQAVKKMDIIAGYVGYSAWIADQFDAHLPINVKSRISVNINNGSLEKVSITQPLLVKEAYIPYYYNVHDLTPTIYNMFVSLFTSRDDIYARLTQRKGGSQRSTK